MPKLLKKRYLTVGFLLAAAGLLVSGCGMQPQAPAGNEENIPAEEQELFRAATSGGSSTNQQVTTIQAKLATIKSNAQACIQDPACINQKVDELLVALSNRLLIGYSTVRVGIVGGVNANGKAGSGYSYRLLTNNGSGYIIASKSGQPFQATPISGRAALAAAVTAAKLGLTPYAGAAVAYVDANTGTIAVGGADLYGYTYCYVVTGVAPLCYSAGW